jgi:hypothetical protein
MRFEGLLNSVLCLCVSLPVALCVTAALASGALAGTEVKIDTVADKYALQDFSFEVSPETGKAGIRIEYSYPASWLEGDDTDRGPAPRIALLAGLRYDGSAHAIVYDDGATRTTCAVEADHAIILLRTAHMKSTGACKVWARVTHHSEDNGWSINRFKTLDTYFEVRRK